MDDVLEILGINEEFLIMCFRVLVTLLLCGFIGYERDMKKKPAGLRTHILVGIGSCGMILFSIYGLDDFTGEQYQMDMARIPSYIISGIGFLGAGAIIKNDEIKGLTTAASIWLVAVIGILVGIGLYAFSIFMTLLVVFSLYVLKKLDK